MRRAFDRGVADLDDRARPEFGIRPMRCADVEAAGAGRTRRRGRTRRCRRTSTPNVSNTTCSPATLAPLACASSLTSLSSRPTPVDGIERHLRLAVLEAAHRVHPPGAEQLAEQVDEARSADAPRPDRRRSRRARTCRRRAPRRRRSRRRAPACRTRSRRPRRPGRPGTTPPGCGRGCRAAARCWCRCPSRRQAILVREIDREHARRGVGADVAADDRQPVDARLRDGSAAAAGGRVVTRLVRRRACPPPSRSR